MSKISKNITNTEIRCTLRNFDIKITFLNHTVTKIKIPVNEILISLTSKPLLYATFLYDIITNNFSYDIIQFILSRIDYVLPGENSPILSGNLKENNYTDDTIIVKKFWRKSFNSEVSTFNL